MTCAFMQNRMIRDNFADIRLQCRELFDINTSEVSEMSARK